MPSINNVKHATAYFELQTPYKHSNCRSMQNGKSYYELKEKLNTCLLHPNNSSATTNNVDHTRKN